MGGLARPTHRWASGGPAEPVRDSFVLRTRGRAWGGSTRGGGDEGAASAGRRVEARALLKSPEGLRILLGHRLIVFSFVGTPVFYSVPRERRGILWERGQQFCYFCDTGDDFIFREWGRHFQGFTAPQLGEASEGAPGPPGTSEPGFKPSDGRRKPLGVF